MSPLKKLRKKLGYSLDYVSSKTTLARGTIAAAEKGKCQKYRTASQLSKFYDGIILPEQILSYRDDSNTVNHS